MNDTFLWSVIVGAVLALPLYWLLTQVVLRGFLLRRQLRCIRIYTVPENEADLESDPVRIARPHA
jgi:hypothetical protein